MFTSKLSSLAICFVIYLLAFYFSFILLPETINNIWLKITIWHIYATLFVYFGSLVLKNSSLYDPFWSVAPLAIVIYLATISENSVLINLIILIPIIFWGIRLTRNWIIGWPGLNHEDFRYIDLKNTHWIKSEINNLFGIHLFPTLIVNLSLYPLLYVFTYEISITFSLCISLLFTLLAVVLETIADEQMRNFRNNPANKGKTMKFKLWKYSRHPNYLGELLFWFGICLIGINSDAAPILIILCPIPMMMLFIFVSCPLMDERSLKNRSDYQEYMEKTSQLLLLPPKE